MFRDFKIAVQKQFDRMKDYDLFYTKVNKDILWIKYLDSFPEGSNPLFRERTEHDCQCCKQFIRTIGNVVAIIDNKIESIWDIEIEGDYKVVAKILSRYIKSKYIDNIFLHNKQSVGVDKNYQQIESGKTLTWEHFYLKLPKKVAAKTNIAAKQAKIKTSMEVLYRSLLDITEDAIETVLELIDQKSLYRGEENYFAVNTFGKLKKEFEKLTTNKKVDIFCWKNAKNLTESVTHIRSTAIGSLLLDISEGRDLEQAISSFERKVAPANYKRPTAIITKAMINKAQEKVEELGFISALERRYAVTEDITINNVLFANREAKKRMNVFDELVDKAPDKLKNLDKIEEVHIDTFIENILPKASTIELMFENRHTNNLVSLIAPINKNAKHMFKWYNNFSWAYTGELADSIKQRVKNAGGNVEGDLRCSLSWFNYDDLDLRMNEPYGCHIYYKNKVSRRTGGNLDVDMNAGSGKTRNAVENICYPNRDNMREGIYDLSVHNYSKRESIDVGFEVEIEFDGIIHSFSYPKAVRQDERVLVAKFQYTKKGGIKFIKSLPSSQTSKEVWNIATQHFHKVTMIMYSPNYWDNKSIGNKHYFFMLDNCLNDGKARGFFNEFLTDKLKEHRKVFEVLGSKMKTEKSTNQLSGLGFSSTQRNNVFCRVKGNFTRTIKLTF